jgi:RNA-directed DNA polymerase
MAILFMHYVFDRWMARSFPSIPFERCADDIICHCRSEEEARRLWNALELRLRTCRLVLHPTKTKLVCCKDTNRRGDFPVQSFDFLGYTFRPRYAVWRGRRYVTSFLPAASPKALKAIRQTIRRWALHHRTDKSLADLARMFRPYIQGWINYYSHFYKSELTPTEGEVLEAAVTAKRDKAAALRHLKWIIKKYGTLSRQCGGIHEAKRRLSSGDLHRKGAPLGRRSRASLLVDLSRDEMALLIEMVVHLGVN